MNHFSGSMNPIIIVTHHQDGPNTPNLSHTRTYFYLLIFSCFSINPMLFLFQILTNLTLCKFVIKQKQKAPQICFQIKIYPGTKQKKCGEAINGGNFSTFR